MKRRTAILSLVAALSLTAAGFAAAHGRPPGDHGRPSVTPPPWSNGHGHGHGHERGDGHHHGHGHDA